MVVVVVVVVVVVAAVVAGVVAVTEGVTGAAFVLEVVVVVVDSVALVVGRGDVAVVVGAKIDFGGTLVVTAVDSCSCDGLPLSRLASPPVGEDDDGC